MKSNPQPLFEVVMICLVTLFTLAVYSFIDYEIKFGVELKKSEMKAFFTPPQNQPFIRQKFDLALPKIISRTLKSDELARVDTSSQTILLTGDSMCEGLMFRFNDYVKYNNHKIKTVIWYGSTTIKWSESDSLKKLIDFYKPSYVFFTTGSNELFIRNIQEREKHIQNIVSQVGSRKFIWIGPPNWAEDTGINDLIVKNVGQDRFFESKNLQFDRASDGAHPTFKSAAVWADTISAWVMQKSRHKIMLKRPKKS
ncbi:MAG: SGNH/GDSL hydrolase family protein [Microscillaceae bacterium]|jgi:hypothetical protein|nr:SGNH/GDSL hydrolase family protein [Microscillaceae bacterium]